MMRPSQTFICSLAYSNVGLDGKKVTRFTHQNNSFCLLCVTGLSILISLDDYAKQPLISSCNAQLPLVFKTGIPLFRLHFIQTHLDP